MIEPSNAISEHETTNRPQEIRSRDISFLYPVFLLSMINSSQTDQALPVKTSKPNFVTFFVYLESAGKIICEISSFVTAANP